MKYPLIFYTNRFIPEGSAACTRGPVIFIRPEYKDDIGLYAHELTHVKQAFTGLLIVHALMYRFLPDYRLACEVEAYREQLKHYDDDRSLQFAKFICEDYGLDISFESALDFLKNGY